jgi:Flp pilus assembly protein protease CpaA
LLLAVASDIRTRRIPNALVGGGMMAGLVLNGLLPEGAARSLLWGWFWPGSVAAFYLIRAMGAGM